MAERTRRDPEPPELAALLDLSERPRRDDWSLRAALTRYAQPEPARVAALLNCVRRLEFALTGHQTLLRSRGPEIWSAVTDDAGRGPVDEELRAVTDLLRAMLEVDRLADDLVAWAVHRDGERPDGSVDAVTADLLGRLEAMGVPEQERPRPPRGRG